MRWFWIDRFTEFVSGERATAIKNVTLSEEHLHDHFPGRPVMPNTLVLEGLAQTAGLLVSEINDFRELVILAKVSRSKFHFDARPGDTLTYEAVVEQINENGALTTTTSHVGDRLQAEAEIFFAHLGEGDEKRSLFEPETFLAWLNGVGLFDVGRTPDGAKIEIPAHLLT